MIGYLSGRIVWANKNNIILDVNGVGYEVNYKNNITVGDFGTSKKIFITRRISDFGEAQYGFDSVQEKLIFETLLTIKGIGPKAISQIMHDLGIKTIGDLKQITLDKLVKVDGVGKTTAQKFLLGLSTKLKTEFDMEKINSSDEKNIENKFDDVINVLVEWGVKKKNIIEFLHKNIDVVEKMKTEKVIEYVLKNMK